MITAIIRNKENTLVLELPHSIYDIYEKLQSIGIMQPPKQIPLTDNEDEDIVCDGDCENCPIADMDCDGDCEDCPCSDNCDESEAN